MPPGFQLLDNFVSSITYEFSPQDGAVSRMFDALTKEAGEHGILDWGISQTRCDAPRNADVGGGRSLTQSHDILCWGMPRTAWRTCSCELSARTMRKQIDALMQRGVYRPLHMYKRESCQRAQCYYTQFKQVQTSAQQETGPGYR